MAKDTIEVERVIPWSGRWSKGVWGRGYPRLKPTLSSLPWCTPHRHPSALHLSSEPSPQSTLHDLSTLPGEPGRKVESVAKFIHFCSSSQSDQTPIISVIIPICGLDFPVCCWCTHGYPLILGLFFFFLTTLSLSNGYSVCTLPKLPFPKTLWKMKLSTLTRVRCVIRDWGRGLDPSHSLP